MPSEASAEGPKWRHRIRDIVFSLVDEAVFCLALRELAPYGVYVVYNRSRDGNPPAIRSSSLDFEDRRGFRIWLPHEPDWRPKLRHGQPDGWAYVGNAPPRALAFEPSNWEWGPEFIAAKWAWDPPTIGAGCISGSYRAEDVEQRRFLRRVWRIIERISTNRYIAGHPRGNRMMFDDRLLMSEPGGDIWIGHHALEWSRAGGERRLLDGKFRPRTDWQPPSDPWYLALRAEVEARYGDTLSQPPIARPAPLFF